MSGLICRSRFNTLRGVARNDRGASAVEFAIILAVLLLILFGTIEFGIAFHRQQGLEAAAREGARLASVGGSYDEILVRVRDAQSLFEPQDVDVITDPSSAGVGVPCGTVGELVTVTVVVQANPAYSIVIPLWNEAEVTFTADGTFRCEKTA